MPARELDPIRPGDVEAMKAFYAVMREFGSFNPSADFQVLMATDRIRHMAVIETYRCLMEPVFSWREDNEGALAVTVFRPFRDMAAGEVYNWLRHMKCYPASFEDVAYVLDESKRGNWLIYLSELPGKRIYYPDPDAIYDEQMVTGDPCSFEYVYLPKDLSVSDDDRSGLQSQVVSKDDLVITWNFPEDPVRQWHDPHGVPRNPKAEKQAAAEAARMNAILSAASCNSGVMEAIRALAAKRQVSLAETDIEQAVATLRSLAAGDDFNEEQVEQAKAILIVVSEATLSYVQEIQGPIVR